MTKDSLGDRMKAYENIERRYLPRRMALIVRLDGVHFHTYTRGFERPYDESFLNCMRQTACDVCKNIEGAKLAYTQSDEISILITDDDELETQPWFGKNLQKIVSVAASMATYFFNKHVSLACGYKEGQWQASTGLTDAWEQERMAVFDGRAFVLPDEEVMNYFEWRQQDATRNSIQSTGQAYFSHKQLDRKTCNDIQDMLMNVYGINWNDMPTAFKRGVCAKKVPCEVPTPEGEFVKRLKWRIDTEIPIFHKDPEYINQYVYHRERNNA